MQETPPPEEAGPKRENIRRQVIAYLVLGVLLTAALVAGIAARQGAFARTAQLYFMADTAAGIAPGVGVRLSGFRIGSVTDMALQSDLKVRVTLEIEEQHFAALRADASAEWFKEQLQAAIIELRPGTSATPLSRSDPRVAHSRRRTLTEVANDLRARLVPVLEDVKEITGTVASNKSDIAALLANARSASQELASTTQELRALVTNAKGQVAGLSGQAQGAMGQVQGALGQAQQTLNQVTTLVGKADQSMASINTRLPQLLNQTSDTLEQLNQVARDVRAVSSAASASLPSVMRTAAPLVEETREVVGGVKSNWLVRSMMAPAPTPLLPIDSHDAKALREPAPR